MDIDMLQAQIDALTERVKELEAKLLELYLPLPWDEAPTWARWAAMDKDHGWWWYESEPLARTTTWISERVELACESFAGPPCDDWRKSKQARPLAQP